MKRNIWIKNGTLEITKRSNGEYMLNDRQTEMFVYAENIELTSANKSTWLNLYTKETYTASFWIENEGDRLAIEGLMAL